MANSSKEYQRLNNTIQEKEDDDEDEDEAMSSGWESRGHHSSQSNTDTASVRTRTDSGGGDTEYTSLDTANERLLPQSKIENLERTHTDNSTANASVTPTRKSLQKRRQKSIALSSIITTLDRSGTPRADFSVIRLSPDSPVTRAAMYGRFLDLGQPLEDPPPDNMCCAIASVFFCAVIGGFAIHQAYMSRKAAKVGDRMTAEESGRYANQLSWAGIFLGILMAILIVVVFITPQFSKT
ncbi:uncharacterized protein LOC144436414 isoform X2 [Glandiceps talaboti]